ncbi:hypothetical protein CLV46_2117 [Diaminobutyricimonas aerilata]|uniref:Lipoprotein n=1 Tax=Diaminobutyricimonas aerilata TaxID=1162967 RepID=A0A2M9CKV9_9MICO|nr:hypothetical protein [Diaminobutyricimonas aerilata]PJJ72545.1 hypothetical protein CLV46_2117 [Diaminobutyricimonas aerilata]
MRARAGIAVALVALAALAGCAAQPEPGPLTREEKIAQLQEDVDTQWEDVSRAYPELGLGVAPRVAVVTEGEQLRERQACFTGLGIEVRVQLNGGMEFPEAPEGGTPFEVANVACWSAIVPESQLEWVWSDAQLQAVWLHHVRSAECLERFGLDVPEPVPFAQQQKRPEGVFFLYSASGLDVLSAPEQAAIAAACPGTPRWLPTG